MTFGLLSSQNNSTLAEFSVSGQWDLFSLYQPENDIPAQRAALEELYIATQGQNWTPEAFFSTVPLEAIEDFAYYYANYSGRLACPGSSFSLQQDKQHELHLSCRHCVCGHLLICGGDAAQGTLVHAWVQLLSMVGC